MTELDDIAQFVDGLDSIPSLMELTKTAPASPRRFRGLANNSHNVDQTMKGYCEVESKSYSNYSKKMVWQASKVLSELAKMDDTRKAPQKRELHEIASIAKTTMTRKSADRVVGQSDNIFKNYDLSRSGVVTYDDFQQTLLAKNAGLSKKEAIELAFALDKDRTGVLEYNTMVRRLADLESTARTLRDSAKRPQTAQAQPPPPSSYLDSFNRSQPERQSSETFVLPEKDGYQRAFELGLQQAERERGREERVTANEERFRQRSANIDIPSREMVFAHTTLLPPPPGETSPHKTYHRACGVRPDWETDKVADLLHARPRRKPKVDAAKVAEHRPSWEDDELTSYTEVYMKSRGVRPEHSHDRRHITGVGALPTQKVELPKGDDAGGPVSVHCRMYHANSANMKNQSSRGFLNSFVVDQARPTRKKRSTSAPPRSTSRTNLSDYDSTSSSPKSEVTGRSLHSHLTRDARTRSEKMSADENKSSDSPPAQDELIVMPYHQRCSEGVNEALTKDNVPTTSSYVDTKQGKKLGKGHCNRSMIAHPRTSSVQISMNTLLSQVNSHSKIKVLQDKLNRIDISKSGYANKSEFSSVLGRVGVHMTPEQIDSVFEANVHEGVGVAPGAESSLDLSSHRRGINIKDFVQKLHVRSSAAVVQTKMNKRGVPTRGVSRAATVAVTTPIEAEDRVTWKKIVNAFEDPHGVSTQSLQFFREAQAKHGNEVHPEQLREELNYIGARLNETEFHNVLADISRNPHGMIDIDDFTQELHRRSAETKAVEKWSAIIPALEHNPESSSPHAKTISALQRQQQSGSDEKHKKKYNQRKHFSNKFGQESSSNVSTHEKSLMYASLLSIPDTSHNTPSDQHVPACLRVGDTKVYRQERLKWSKLRQSLINRRSEMLHAFGGVEQATRKLSRQDVRDRLYSAGVLLGDDDFSLLCSYASTSSSAAALAAAHGEAKNSDELNFESICESIGVSTDIDSRKKQVAACREDYMRDGGIFGASETSLLAHPTYRTSMLTSSTDDCNLVKGNRRRRYHPESGKPIFNGAADVKTSEFFEFNHIPEIKFLPATNSRKTNSVTPTHKYQGTSLRELQRDRDRKRSSSAPPRSSGSSSTHSSYMWQRTDKGAVPFSRFASTPLAQYIAMRQNASFDTSAAGRLHASELNASSIASSTTNSQMQSEVDS